MLGNVKHSPKKEQGVKEVLAVMGIAGNMGSSINFLDKVNAKMSLWETVKD